MRLLAVLLLGISGCGGEQQVSPSYEPRTVNAAPAVHTSDTGRYAVTELVIGLEHPWGLAFIPGGDMLVTERPGRLRRISSGGQVSPPVTGLPDLFVDGQAGLLDVAVSPTFASDNLVYLSFAEPNLRGNKAGTSVVRGRLQGGVLHDPEVVYRQEPKVSHGTHVGSRLVFDDVGHLFVTQGDNRVAATAAQDLEQLSGKLVRIWPDGRIPDENPS